MRADLIAFDKVAISGYKGLVGIDEAGRGALAGPVVAGAVWVDASFFEKKEYEAIWFMVNDSKQLSSKIRECVFDFTEQLRQERVLNYACGIKDVVDIEHYNILRATQQAMTESLIELERSQNISLEKQDGFLSSDRVEPMASRHPIRVLVDGNYLKNFPYKHDNIIKGDMQSFVIALASIMAKVTRDRLMMDYQKEYPVYAFCKHKGYGTQEHRTELCTHGPSAIHRSSFIKKILSDRVTNEQKEFQWL